MLHQINLAMAAVATDPDKAVDKVPGADKPVYDKAAVDASFAALKTYDWGADTKLLKAIDDAAIVAHNDPAVQKSLESQLAGVLKTDVSRDAKDYACRKLMMIGTAASVPALAELLPNKECSHMARYALERIPAPEAAQAMRDAIPNLSAELKVGVIGSLGARRDAASVAALTALLKDSDPAVAVAAACALGDIGAADASQAMSDFAKKVSDPLKPAAIDALFVAAERLLADGKKAQAMRIYKSLNGENQPKHVRLAAARGLLLTVGKKE